MFDVLKPKTQRKQNIFLNDLVDTDTATQYGSDVMTIFILAQLLKY